MTDVPTREFLDRLKNANPGEYVTEEANCEAELKSFNRRIWSSNPGEIDFSVARAQIGLPPHAEDVGIDGSGNAGQISACHE